MGWFDGFDQYIVYRISTSPPGTTTYRTRLRPALNGATHDLDRGFKRKNFWVMETEPAFVNWGHTNNPLDRGQIREMAWQAVGHGADAVEYWQWRARSMDRSSITARWSAATDCPYPFMPRSNK